MRGSGILGLLATVVGALVIADLWRNASVTNNLIKSSTSVAGLIAGK